MEADMEVPESRKATVPEKKERDIDFEQPLRDRGCHKPRSPRESMDHDVSKMRLA